MGDHDDDRAIVGSAAEDLTPRAGELRLSLVELARDAALEVGRGPVVVAAGHRAEGATELSLLGKGHPRPRVRDLGQGARGARQLKAATARTIWRRFAFMFTITGWCCDVRPPYVFPTAGALFARTCVLGDGLTDPTRPGLLSAGRL